MSFATTIVGIITAVATCATAVGGLLLAMVAFRTKAAVTQVHTIVNQQRTDMLNLIAEQQQRNRVLALALRRAGVEIPAEHGEERS